MLRWVCSANRNESLNAWRHATVAECSGQNAWPNAHVHSQRAQMRISIPCSNWMPLSEVFRFTPSVVILFKCSREENIIVWHQHYTPLRIAIGCRQHVYRQLSTTTTVFNFTEREKKNGPKSNGAHAYDEHIRPDQTKIRELRPFKKDNRVDSLFFDLSEFVRSQGRRNLSRPKRGFSCGSGL